MGKNDPDYYKNWYKQNKDKHLDYCTEKVQCECGKYLTRTGLYAHKKTRKHIENLLSLEESKKFCNQCKVYHEQQVTQPPLHIRKARVSNLS